VPTVKSPKEKSGASNANDQGRFDLCDHPSIPAIKVKHRLRLTFD
jgi:hypothetical protein